MKSRLAVALAVLVLSFCLVPAATAHEPEPSAVVGSLLVLGASYTQGVGASTPHDGYAFRLGHDLGLPTDVAGVGGTGYLNPGPHHQGTFALRMTELPRTLHPGLVLLQGGRNDAGYPPGRLFDAVIATVEEAKLRFGGAQIVLLGPIPATLPAGRDMIDADGMLARAAHHCHVGYIDPIAENWITPANEHRFTGRVPGHPNDAGHAYIAARVAADLRSGTLTPTP